MDQIIYGNHGELYEVFNSIAPIADVLLAIFFTNRIYDSSFVSTIFNAGNGTNKITKLFSKLIAYFLLAFTIIINFAIGEAVNPPISQLFLGSEVDAYFCVIFATPIVVFIASLIFRIAASVIEDIIAFLCSICLVFFKIACIFAGCCYGIEYNGRFYNVAEGAYQLPVQIIETICAVFMCIVLIALLKKKLMSGKLMPLYLLMYCGSRFISEFWRADFPPVLWKMNGNHIQCLIGFALGVIYMIIAVVFGKKLNAYFDKRNNAFGEKLFNYLTYVKQNNPKSKLFSKPLNYCISTIIELAYYVLLIEVIFKGLRNVNAYNALFNAIGMNSVGIMLSFIASTLIGIAILFVLNKKTIFANDSNQKSSIIKFVVVSLIIAIISTCVGSAIISSMISRSIHIIFIDIISKLITLIVSFILMYLCDKYFIHIDKKDYIR